MYRHFRTAAAVWHLIIGTLRGGGGVRRPYFDSVRSVVGTLPIFSRVPILALVRYYQPGVRTLL